MLELTTYLKGLLKFINLQLISHNNKVYERTPKTLTNMCIKMATNAFPIIADTCLICSVL